MKIKLVIRLLLLAISASSTHSAAAKAVADAEPPIPAREFRGAWVASVGNIDWPSKPGLTVEQQKAELTAILNRAVQLKLNAIIFQVRPACDALYASKLEPWSEYITGQMGKAPEPAYDPLAFAVAEAHQRGLELHAWFNPFRARHIAAKSPISSNHISKTRPELVRAYGKYLWLDPGEKAARDYSLSVMLDVVKRYDIDGIHIDDYFYPYKEKDASGNWMDFPDETSWQRYVKSGGKLARNDWRRENVDQFVQQMYRSVKAQKSWVKVGVSPFGIWRPGHPAQIKGLDAYDQLYADARKWLSSGWVDYFAPQLYWAIDPPAQSYPVLLQWWTEQNPMGRHLWPGNNSTRVPSAWSADEIIKQIELTRSKTVSNGNIHWNMKSLMRESPLPDALAKSVYTQPALVPASPWLDKLPPGKPKLVVKSNKAPEQLNAAWEATGNKPVSRWVLQSRTGSNWTTEILPGGQNFHAVPRNGGAYPDLVAVSAVDRFGNIGPAAIVETAVKVARN